MLMKKRALIIVFLILSTFLLASCASQSPGEGINKTIQNIIAIGQLKFLGVDSENMLTGFMRVLIFILVFALLFEGSRLIGLSRNIGITIAIVLSIISVIFIPGSVLAGIGAAYGTLVAFILIGIPVVIGLWALYAIPATSRWQVSLKIVIILILIWILMAIKGHATDLAGAATDVWFGVPFL